MGLTGKVALVTGGGRGIGRAAALALAAAGADVAVVARSEQASDTAEAIRHMGRRTLPLQMDVADPTAAAQAVAATEAALGPVAVLVNNAGVAPSLKFTETTIEIWHRTIEINLNGAFYFCRAALPAMLAAGWGRIINIASTAAKQGYAYNAAYVASKHGLLGLTRALAVEVAKKGVTVNAVCPGFVDTALVAEATRNLMNKTGRTEAEARQTFAAFNPHGRLLTPAEVADAIVFLTSEAAGSINGQGIVIDGGGVQA